MMTIDTNDNTNSLPSALYRARQVRAMDRYAIDTLGIPGFELMQRAGKAAFEIVLEWSPAVGRVLVFCGAGNNGGDGYVVARLMREAGLEVTVQSLTPIDRLRGDALAAFQRYRENGGLTGTFDADALQRADLVVDALLGTGLDRPVSGGYARVIEAVNRCSAPVLAIDIPSGLHADTGSGMGCAVEADRTITFIGLKQGLFTGEGPDCCGTIDFSSLDVPAAAVQIEPPSARLYSLPRPVLAPRRRSAHKGRFGHVLVIGGEAGYIGAVRLAAEAALRVGAGLVTVATRPAHAALSNCTRPEIMSHGVESGEALTPVCRRATVAVIGPGLGQSQWAAELLGAACHAGLPMVVDADALNLLAHRPMRRNDWIMTPHPGEAARLLGCGVAEIQCDRFSAVEALQRRYGGVCVLKGAGSLVYDGLQMTVNTTGNPGMASGGMGDVLSGVTAGLMAQGLSIVDAARAAVARHGAAGDRAALDGERGLLAGDLMTPLREAVNR